MDQLFELCVDFLNWLANLIGMTYNEINIWIFVIIEPMLFIVGIWVIISQRKKIKNLKKQINKSA